MNMIIETLETIKFGEFVKFENMEMVPLLAERAADYQYGVLDDVLKAESVRITEVSEGGTVPELSFLNESDEPVFLMDGEELVGAKQNWSCPGLVPVTCLIYAATLSNARGLLPPNVECLRRGL